MKYLEFKGGGGGGGRGGIYAALDRRRNQQKMLDMNLAWSEVKPAEVRVVGH